MGNAAGKLITTGTNNTIVGSAAGDAITTQSDNTLIGYQAGTFTTGTGNVAVGSGAGAAVTTGARNTFVGYQAGTVCTTGADNIIVGYGVVTGAIGESNKIRIGGASGTGAGQQNALYCAAANNSIGVAGTALYIDGTTGKIGLTTSSRRYKDNIQDMAQSSSDVTKLCPVTFNFKSDVLGARQFGLIAEEVAEVYPELVWTKDGQPEGVHYDRLPVMLLNEYQKMMHTIDDQSKTIALLQAQNAMLIDKVDMLATFIPKMCNQGMDENVTKEHVAHA
ncbi:MAG: hypothetical protein UU47_C0024G0008 [candidate division TM6 bacterium GW2011_GWE2_41_16]|nr:MAG: hypothetical protein UU47_C0024G0008 [candidate division TM6 bacterium GW2011_GWE2_41_16]